MPDRTHLEDFSLDEFNPLFRSEYACLGHAMILVDGEEFFRCLGLHTLTPFEWIITPPLSAEYRNSAAATKALEFQMELVRKSRIVRTTVGKVACLPVDLVKL
jgi:hypothetical protein